MARIRTVKPEFFRHEGLQDLEIANPGSYVMLVFAGLWGHCDKAGRFEWKPRTLKLDILPFLEFGMEKTLLLLEGAGMLRRYTVDGKEYGEVVTFEKHQRINGKEAQEPERFPSPSQENIENKEGSSGEAAGKKSRSQEGKGREEEQEGNGGSALRPAAESISLPVADAPGPEGETILQANCRKTWEAYAAAYLDRYSTAPVRNAKVSSQVKQFVQRIGGEESPMVAGWFVSHPGGYYVGKLHDFGALLADAEKLRTEWATGRVMTQSRARQSDRAGGTMAALNEVLSQGGAQ
jgi:hypothetical protein